VTSLFFDAALLPDGWSRDVRIEIDGEGWITGVTAEAAPDGADHHGTIAVSGMPNLHSHAFQRAMAGLTEVRGAGDDSFWTWRQAMYRFVDRLNPSHLLAIAGLLYAEMLEAGFTSVAEFHYLHHDPDGNPYADIGAMAAAVAEAASETGMGLTLLPVFYANAGFGGQPPSDGQRRFINSPDGYGKLVDRVGEIAAGLNDGAVGIAPHSLRAVTPESLGDILPLAAGGPIHIHIAEQTQEVDECLNWSGQRPVAWLFDHVAVDDTWCLVHATHMTDGERRQLAAGGAVAGLCPITEANLGDGIFDGANFVAEGGTFGIGSDSNVFISVAEELRLLEYSQRLRDQGRNRLAGHGSVGAAIYAQALRGGARATGRAVGQLAAGRRGDVVSLDSTHPALVCRDGDQWLDGWLFAGDNRVVADVWAGGNHVVKEGRHVARQHHRQGFAKVLAEVLGA